jgi:GNAT superfamily N-acetyltransferase
MSDWSLRLARIDDADQMPEIERAAAQLFAEAPDLQERDLDKTRELDDFRRLIRKGHCLVSHVDEAMVGFLVCEPFSRELHVWEVDVHPDFQQRKIGAGLMRACLIDARNSGFRAVTLTTFRDLPWNGPFYARLGFEEVTALDAHPRLAAELVNEIEDGLSAERRCAMICFLD